MEDAPFLLRRDAAADYIRNNFPFPCSVQTLAKLASSGGGPLYRYSGRFPVYDIVDLNTWATERTGPKVGSVSEAREASAA
jgi:hypothetical protein